MVKSLLSIFSALLLIAGLAVSEHLFVTKQFTQFEGEIASLVDKVEAETANGEDAKAVQERWERRKQTLHVWIPHNDIARIDDYMSETVGLISRKNYGLALAKLRILSHLTKCLPGTYRPAVENIL